MARGGRRGRPKQTQPGASPSNSNSYDREELQAGEEAIAETIPISTPLGNGTVPVPVSPEIELAPNRGIVSSYAALVNPDEGTALNFMQGPIINGTTYAK